MFIVKGDVNIKENHIGYVTPSTLCHFKVLNKSWVRLNITDQFKRKLSINEKFEQEETKKDDVVIQVIIQNDTSSDELFDTFMDETNKVTVSSTTYQTNIIYVSYGTLFMMAKYHPDLYNRYVDQECDVEITPIEDFTNVNELNYAMTVDVSLISCPSFSLIEDDCSIILKDFFTVPRLLQKDEVFPILLKDNTVKRRTESSQIWYKVNKLELSNKAVSHLQTNALFVDDRFSKLYMSNPVRSVVPLCSCNLQNNLSMIRLYKNSYFGEAFLKMKTEISKLLFIIRQNLVSAADALALIEGKQGIGKGLVIRSICFQHCVHYYEENCFNLIGDSLSATDKRIAQCFEFAKNNSPCVLYLKNIHLLCKDKEGTHEERRIVQSFENQLKSLPTDAQVLVVGSTTNSNELSVRFISRFIYHFNLDPPNEHERLCLVKALAQTYGELDINFEELARKSAGFIVADLLALFSRTYITCSRMEQQITQQAVDTVLDEIRQLKSGSSNAVKIPKVTWDDVGGLQNVKDDIMDTLELPLKFPKLFTTGLRRSGLLFYGPPGCGKTLLAKAIATEFSLNFYSVKGPELINMYVGQSEENVREVFKNARSMAPCVIFFDEIDSLAPNRGRSGDSGGVMDRIVSQLLSELDGMHDNTDIFVVGATNRPDLLDPSLLRPGRFDKLIYVGIPEGHTERLRIFQAVTRKLRIDPNIILDDLIQLCPLNLTGADFYSLASDTMMNCYRRVINKHKIEGCKLNTEHAIVTLDDFKIAIERLTPSVSMLELQRYKAIKNELDVR